MGVLKNDVKLLVVRRGYSAVGWRQMIGCGLL